MNNGRKLLIAVATLAVLFSGVLWTRDLVAEARVPETMCGGLIRTSEARMSDGFSRFEEVMGREPAPGLAELECDAWPFQLRAHALGKNPAFVRRTMVRMTSGQVPLGEALQGAADPDRAWFVVPCPSVGAGTPLFVAAVREHVSFGEAEESRRTLAAVVVRVARFVVERAGCGGPEIPDASPVEVRKPKQPEGIADTTFRREWNVSANVPVPSAGSDVCGLLPVTAFAEGPERASVYASARTPQGGAVEFCQTFDEAGGRNFGFAVTRGDLVPYLREEGGDVNGQLNGSADLWLNGTCAGRPVLFHENSVGTDYFYELSRAAEILRTFAAAYAVRNGCVLEGRMV